MEFDFVSKDERIPLVTKLMEPSVIMFLKIDTEVRDKWGTCENCNGYHKEQGSEGAEGYF